MTDFTFVTTNSHKALTAKHVCNSYGITFEQKPLDLVEIQADNGEDIGIHKVQQAFEQLKQPVIISDDSWHIAGLKGFPGPYMKYVNHWFTPEDFLRLTRDLTDRRITLHQVLVYKDDVEEKVFSVDLEGTLLKEARGKDPAFPHFAVTSLDNGQHSLAEADEKDRVAVAHHRSAYHLLCEWLNSR